MSVQHEQAVTRSIALEHRAPSRSLAERLLRRMLRGIECGQLIVDTPAGERLIFEGARPGPQARLAIHRWRCLWRLLSGADVGFGEGYVAGEWSSPNLAALLNFGSLNSAVEEPLRLFRLPRLGRKLQHALNRNTRRGSRRNIAAHYDLGNSFYEQWLDPGMSYSSALYTSAAQTLEEAQDAKLDRVIDLLEMSGGERVLEIGCGWGSLAERLLTRHDCTLTGLTLSAEQLAVADGGLAIVVCSPVAILGCKITVTYAALLIASSRSKCWRLSARRTGRRTSKPCVTACAREAWPFFRSSPSIKIDSNPIAGGRISFRNIFPGGMLPTTSIIEREASGAGLKLVTKKLFDDSYARTLAEWQFRFQNAWHRIEALGYNDRFKRTWEYYLAYCQAGFETGALNVGLYKLAHKDVS